MYSVDEAKDSISFSISSEMKLVDRIVKEARDFLAANGMEEGFSGVKLVLRELLINAVEHGNLKIPAKKAFCELRTLSPELCLIRVEDEGDGFNWRELKLQIPDDPSKIRNRGFPLVNAIADKLEFNEKGNETKAYVSLQRKTAYKSSRQDDGWTLVEPSGDITAASSEILRETLHKLVASGMEKCRFDFAKVSDIDSVGLSALIILSRAMAERGTAAPKLEVVNAAPDIKRLFEMTMLDSVYKIEGRSPVSA